MKDNINKKINKSELGINSKNDLKKGVVVDFNQYTDNEK